MIGALSRLKAATILVVGDFMLDVYTRCHASRLSPEAPVPVLRIDQKKHLPGGAGNVAFNLQALGARVIPVGRIGADRNGELLKNLFQRERIETAGLFIEPNWPTPVKNRLIADGQQLVRVDDERIAVLSAELEKRIIDFVAKSCFQLEIIALSDYAKGLLSRSLLRAIIDLGSRYKIPVLVDPKGDDFTKYAGATLITPNLAEAYAAAKTSFEAPLTEVGKRLLDLSQAEQILVTRSEKGMTLFDRKQKPLEFPAKAREVKDVTGAGDTALAMVAMTCASNIDLAEGLYLANIAAGLAVEQTGCARIPLAAIAERLLEVHLSDKIFDEEHLFVLERILVDKQLTVLGLSAKEGVSIFLFHQLQHIARKSERERLLIYIMDTEPDERFVALLSSLREIDFIVLQSSNLAALCRRIVPDRVFAFKEDKLWPISSPERLLT
ncbi:MAG: D-glycero-beta-D-manno-heptose-7-phosphate kinase [Chlamydiota bacterium]